MQGDFGIIDLEEPTSNCWISYSEGLIVAALV